MSVWPNPRVVYRAVYSHPATFIDPMPPNTYGPERDSIEEAITDRPAAPGAWRTAIESRVITDWRLER